MLSHDAVGGPADEMPQEWNAFSAALAAPAAVQYVAPHEALQVGF